MERKIPQDFLEAADTGDYFYVSEAELPWAQAQYECLARKGHLAELDGKSKVMSKLSQAFFSL